MNNDPDKYEVKCLLCFWKGMISELEPTSPDTLGCPKCCGKRFNVKASQIKVNTTQIQFFKD